MSRTKGAKNKKKGAKKFIPVGTKGTGKSVSLAQIKKGDKKSVAEANRIAGLGAKGASAINGLAESVKPKAALAKVAANKSKLVNPLLKPLKAKGNASQLAKKVKPAKKKSLIQGAVLPMSNRSNSPSTLEQLVDSVSRVPLDTPVVKSLLEQIHFPLDSSVTENETKPEFELKPPVPEQKEEAAPLDKVAHKYPEISRPYILKIKNNSMTKIEDFRVNNIKQALQQGKEYDDRVTVIYGLHGYSYQAFLSHFVTHPTKFGRIRYEAFHGYQKYQQQQLMSCPLYVLESDPNGDTKRKAEIMQVALNQFITTAVEKAVNFDFTDLSWDLRLDLLPEVEVSIYLYPAIIANLWKGEEEELGRPDIGGVRPMQLIDDRENIRLKKIIESLQSQLANERKLNAPVSDAAFAKDDKK